MTGVTKLGARIAVGLTSCRAMLPLDPLVARAALEATKDHRPFSIFALHLLFAWMHSQLGIKFEPVRGHRATSALFVTRHLSEALPNCFGMNNMRQYDNINQSGEALTLAITSFVSWVSASLRQNTDAAG